MYQHRWCLFPNSWKYLGMGIEKKTSENKDEYVSESDTKEQPWEGDTRPFDSDIMDC